MYHFKIVSNMYILKNAYAICNDLSIQVNASFEQNKICLLFFFRPQNLLSLSKHVHIHGGEERDVQEHGHQDEEGEAEAGIEAVREAHTEDVVLVGVGQTLELTQKLTRNSSGVGDNEESISGIQFKERRKGVLYKLT